MPTLAQAAEFAAPAADAIGKMSGGWIVAIVAIVIAFVGWMHHLAIKSIREGMGELARATRQAGSRMAKAMATNHQETQAKIDGLPCATGAPPETYDSATAGRIASGTSGARAAIYEPGRRAKPGV